MFPRLLQREWTAQHDGSENDEEDPKIDNEPQSAKRYACVNEAGIQRHQAEKDEAAGVQKFERACFNEIANTDDEGSGERDPKRKIG